MLIKIIETAAKSTPIIFNIANSDLNKNTANKVTNTPCKPTIAITYPGFGAFPIEANIKKLPIKENIAAKTKNNKTVLFIFKLGLVDKFQIKNPRKTNPNK